MTDTTNPFTPSLKTLWTRLNSLNGLFFCLHSQLNDFRGMYKEALHKRGVGLEAVRGGTSLLVRDLSEWPDHGFAQYYSSGLFKVEGEEYLELVEVLLQREATWAISQAFEAFETYVKDATAVYLLENPTCAAAERLEKFYIKYPGVHLNEIISWRLFVDFTYKNAFELLKVLRRLSPLLVHLEHDNNRVLNLPAWLDVLAEVRHATVHSSGVIRAKRIASWNPEKLRILEAYFKAKSTVHGHEARFDMNDVEKLLGITAEYGYIVFKALSEASAYPYEPTLKT